MTTRDQWEVYEKPSSVGMYIYVRPVDEPISINGRQDCIAILYYGDPRFEEQLIDVRAKAEKRVRILNGESE